MTYFFNSITNGTSKSTPTMYGTKRMLCTTKESLKPNTRSSNQSDVPVTVDMVTKPFQNWCGLILEILSVFSSGKKEKNSPIVSPHPIKIAMYAPSWNILAMTSSVCMASNLITIQEG